PRPLASAALSGASRSGPSVLGSWPTVSQPWLSSRVPENTLPTRTSNGGGYMPVPDEWNSPCEAEAPPEEDSPAPTVTMPTSRMGGSQSRPLSASAPVPPLTPLDLPARSLPAPDELHSPWEAAAPAEEEPSGARLRTRPSAASFASSARLQQGGAAMPEEPNAPSEAPSEDDAPRSPSVWPPSVGPSPLQPARRLSSKSGSDVASMEAPPEDEGPPRSNTPGDPPDEKPEPMMSKSPVQATAGKAEHADATQKGDEKKQVLQEGVILLQRYDRKSSCFQLRLCNKKLANLSFTVDISKSVNL
ncbi:unnamed protein product, partial [Symbiodinium microadriaticum]